MSTSSFSFNMICGLVNGTIFNYPYIESCPYVGYEICIPALLSWIHGIFISFMFFVTFTCVVVFYEDKKTTKFKVVIGYYLLYLIYIAASITVICVSIFVIGNCSTFAQTYAGICGSIMAIIVFFKFIPQLWTTFKNKSSGSLSLLGNIFGFAFLVVNILFNIFSTGQHLTTYIGMIVSFVFQVILILMQIYYDYLVPLCGKKKKEGLNKVYDRLDEEENSMRTDIVNEESFDEGTSLLDREIVKEVDDE